MSSLTLTQRRGNPTSKQICFQWDRNTFSLPAPQHVASAQMGFSGFGNHTETRKTCMRGTRNMLTPHKLQSLFQPKSAVVVGKLPPTLIRSHLLPFSCTTVWWEFSALFSISVRGVIFLGRHFWHKGAVVRCLLGTCPLSAYRTSNIQVLFR